MASKSDTKVDISQAMVTEPVALVDWLIVAPVAAGMLFAALLLMWRKRIKMHPPVAITGLALMMCANIGLVIRTVQEGPLTMTMGRWLPPFGISFTVDLLGALFALTGTFVTLVCAVFAAASVSDSGRRYGFYPFLLLMLTGVTGAFLTGDLFNLYVWFEVLLISSFGLIVLGSKPKQIDGALKYAVLNLLATTFFLIATGYTYGVLGTLNMADIATKVRAAPEGLPMLTLASLFFLAFAMKAAAFPVNFWLPASYHTPKIVVSALFAGLLTKVGVYALMRILLTLLPEQQTELSGLISLIAILTMITGVLGALAQSDMRRTMGYLVISGIGMMLAGLALANTFGLTGAIVYAIHSMIVMTGLYLLVGVIGTQLGSFSLHDVGGGYKSYPLLAALAFVLLFGVSGLPPFSGLWPKAMLVQGAIQANQSVMVAAILVTGLLSTIAAGRVFALTFWRSAQPGATTERITARATPVSLVCLAVLAIPVFALGVAPEGLISLASNAASGLIDSSTYVQSVFGGGAQP